MSKEAEIRAAIEAAFDIQELEIINESARHAGHAGDDGSGESHFALRLRATELAALGRVARHRAVHRALGPELVASIHALSLDLG
ncbi:BolA family protein [Aquicoccus porphyridii]|uniref:BolA family transcriptional regulator n=1 Tax=Aquicoccus porphyridii TaxID=1852029 RepID=A0A5A9ZHN0_9RHOB|nr:BolA family protein [Aquicoccus porphyridii]KAA0916773.1 BolA family transcriptional regulator [Aquicoccus porphyridii]RAI53895.1 BolA family transcriptional regulator [Rhodobacteraceae bacterium AsT-22]